MYTLIVEKQGPQEISAKLLLLFEGITQREEADMK